MDTSHPIFPPGSLLILKVCAVVILIGLAILAIDRWIVKAGAPEPEQQRQARATELGFQVIEDPGIKAALRQQLQGWSELTGEVGDIRHAWRLSQTKAELWLVEFASSQRSLVQTTARPRHLEVTRLAIMLKLHDDPAWPRFVSSAQEPAPPQLPGEYAERLAAMDEYQMAIDGRWVAFLSKAAFEPLLQIVEAGQSAEFHPGLLNSALRIDVQRALDISAALPGAPRFERFYAVDVDVQIDTPSVSALSDRLRADRERIATEQAAAREQLRLDMERQRAEFRQRNEENLVRFRERNQENLERLKSAGSEGAGSGDAGEEPEGGAATGERSE
jgi:hypothetical protein